VFIFVCMSVCRVVEIMGGGLLERSLMSLDVFSCRGYAPCHGLKANQVSYEDARVVKGLIFLDNRRLYTSIEVNL
jgi:hypothetical protein